MKSLLILVTMLAASIAFASEMRHPVQDKKDLEQEEINKPGGGECGSSEIVMVTFTCQNSKLTVTTVGYDGTEDQHDVYATSTKDCSDYASQLTQTLGYEIYQSKMMAVCNNSRMQRRLLRMDGTIKELKDLYLTNSAACKTKATEINTRL